MNKIILKELRLLNFKGVHELDVKFDRRGTIISGRNASGKSTVFDAFCWLLFGKNAAGAKVFGIKTTDRDGNIIPRLPHEVAATLTKNGEEVTLRRCFTEKWQKKRGEAEEKFTGNTEERYWNDVPCTATEYDAKVRDLCPEELFRDITDPWRFPTRAADAQRQLLFGMAGDVTDEEVAGTRDDFRDLLTQLSGKTFEEFKKELAARKKVIKESVQAIPGRIDERKRDIEGTAEHNTADLQRDIEDQSIRLQRTEELIEDKSRAYQAAAGQRMERIKHTMTLLEQQEKMSAAIIRQAQSAYYERQKQRQKMRHELDLCRTKLQNSTDRISRYKADLAKLEGKRGELITVYKEIVAAINAANAPMTEADFCCPTCGRRFEPDEIEARRREITERYLSGLKDKLALNKQAGLEVRGQMDALRQQMEQEGKAFDATSAELDRLVNDPLLTDDKNDTLPTGEAELAASEELKALAVEIEQARKAEGEHIEQPDLTELKAQREELSQGLMQLQARLTKAEKDNDSLTKNRQRIAELEQQLARQNEQLAAIEMTEFRMQEFSKAKTRMLEDKVNGLFSLVRYKLFDRQINGAEVECCIPMVNGVSYPDVNTAGKINAGLDIINAISRSRGWSAPIFIDGAESVNTLMPTESQKVLLSVTTEPELHVTPFPSSEAEMFD